MQIRSSVLGRGKARGQSFVDQDTYTREEFLRFKITDIRPAEDVPSLSDSIHKENASSEDSGPWRHRKKSGKIIDVQIRSYR